MCIKAIRNKIKKVGLRKKINELLDFTTINNDAIKITEEGNYNVYIADNGELTLILSKLLTCVKNILAPEGVANKNSSDNYSEELLKAIKGFRRFIQNKISTDGSETNFKLNYDEYAEFEEESIESFKHDKDWGIPCRQELVERNYIYYFSGEKIIKFFESFVKNLAFIERAKEALKKENRNRRGSNPIKDAIKILQAELDKGDAEALANTVKELQDEKCGLYNKDGTFNVSQDSQVENFINQSNLCLGKIYRVCKKVNEFSGEGGSKNSDSSESTEAEKSKKRKKREEGSKAKATAKKYRDEMCAQYFYFKEEEVKALEGFAEDNGGNVDLNKLLTSNNNNLLNLVKKLKAVKDAVDVKTCTRQEVNSCIKTISEYNDNDIAEAVDCINDIANESIRYRIRKVKRAIVIAMAFLLIVTIVVSFHSPLIKFNHLDRSFMYSTQSGEFEFRKYDNLGAEIISAVPLSEDGTVEFPSQVALDSEGWFDKDVVAIGANVFGEESEKNFTAVFIPKSITHIDSDAFDGCNNITFYCEASEKPDGYEDGWSGYNPIIWGVDIGDKIEEVIQADMKFILKEADKTATLMGFDDAGKENLEIPSEVKLDNKSYTVTVISALGENPELKSITVPDSVIKIEKGAFAGCTNLESITLPFVGAELNGTTNTHFGYIFGAGGDKENVDKVPGTLSSITISGGKVAANAFSGCSIKGTIVFEQNVTAIAQGALGECDVKSLTLPFLGKDKSDISHAFLGYIFGATTYDQNGRLVPKSLKQVTIAANKIGDYAFANCSSLEKILVSDGIQEIGCNVFEGCNEAIYNTDTQGAKYIDGISSIRLILVDGTNVSGAYTPNANTRIIANNAFEGCTELSGITIPQEVVMIGDNAFAGCTGITEMVIPNNVQSIGDYAFSDCSGLEGSITIPDSVTSMGSGTFSGCSSLTSITIPDSVTSIKDRTFLECSRLESIILGNDVISIGSYAFSKCTSLAGIDIPNSVKSIGAYAFSDCSNLSGTIEIPYGVTSIEEGVFYNCSKLTRITIPDSVTTIGGSAFRGCSELISIPIPTVVTSLGAYAFFGCSNLSGKIEIPYKVTSIEEKVFYNCSNLTHITIPDSVTVIGDSAFFGCSSLESIIIPFIGAELNGTTNTHFGYLFGAPSYSDNSDYAPSTLKEVVIIGGTTIGDYAFYNCRGLTSITIPDSVTTIGDNAFFGCSSLERMIIPFIGAELNGTANTHFGYIFGATSYSDNSDYVPSTLKEVVITGGTSIDDYAFYDCGDLTSVAMPNSITSFGEGAFFGCSSLESIIIPFIGAELNGTTNTHFGYIFGASSYSNNSSYVPSTLKKVVIIGGTSIDDYAFYDCSGLTSITIPNTTIRVGEYAFSNCNKIIQTENGINYVDKWVIDCDNAVSQVRLRDDTVGIADRAFYNSRSLTSITIPDSVTSIGYEAFWICSGLTSITIPDSVTSIGSYAFRACSGLTSITIPDSVTSIGSSVFQGCSGLENITVEQGNPNYHSAGNCIIETASKTLIAGCKSSVIPNDDSVISIGDYAFCGCNRLTNITIPDSVISIGDYAFAHCNRLTNITIPDSVISIGDEAFTYCSSLTSMTIPDSVTSIESRAFQGCSSLTSITIPDSVASIGDYAFYGCSSLTSMTIPDSVTSIGSYVFSACSGLTSITIPDSVASIGDSAFYGCSSLTSMTIPDSVTSIGSYVFYGCSGLTSITIPDSVTSIEDRAFYGCSSLTSITIPDSVTSIGSDAFSGCSGLTSITIGDSVTSIGGYAFSGCNGLTSITIPDSVTGIGRFAFSDCNSLIRITIPFVGSGDNNNTNFGYIFGALGSSSNNSYVPSTLKEVIITGGTSIGSEAFYYCGGLTSITISDSVTSIGESAFYGCSGLTSITIPDSVISIGKSAFRGCNGLTSVTIGDGVTSIGNAAFYGCSSLTSITIPDSVTSIGESAFRGCSSLTSITIPDSVTSIGYYAFAYCSELTIYCEAESQPAAWSPLWQPGNIPVVWGYKGN